MLFHRIDRLYRTVWLNLLIAAALAVSVTAAQAKQSEIIERVEAVQLFDWMKDAGYEVLLSDSVPNVVRWQLGDSEAWILVVEKGTSLQFHDAFVTAHSVPLTKLNEWNANESYTRTYLTEKGDAVIELDLDLKGGVTKARILEFLKTCKTAIADWRQEVLGE